MLNRVSNYHRVGWLGTENRVVPGVRNRKDVNGRECLLKVVFLAVKKQNKIVHEVLAPFNKILKEQALLWDAPWSLEASLAVSTNYLVTQKCL